jgi:hypothetical protein
LAYPQSTTFPSVAEAYFPRSGWALVYWDDVALIFLRRIPAYADIIKRNEFKAVLPDAEKEYFLYKFRNSSTTVQRAIQTELERNARIHPRSVRTQHLISLLRAAG